MTKQSIAAWWRVNVIDRWNYKQIVEEKNKELEATRISHYNMSVLLAEREEEVYILKQDIINAATSVEKERYRHKAELEAWEIKYALLEARVKKHEVQD